MYSNKVLSEAKRFLNSSSVKARREILKKSSVGFQKLLLHICRLYVNDQIILSDIEERNIKPFNKHITSLANPKFSNKKAVVLLQQGQGIFSILLPLGIALISALLPK